MRIAYDNLFDNYSLTYSGQNSNYPAANVQDSRLSRFWRTTSLTSHTLTVDSGTGNTITPTFAAILNTNLSTGATIKLQGSSSSGFGSSTEITLTRNDTNFVGDFISLSAKRFWRFLIKDTGNVNSYMKVGRAWMGTYFTATPTISKDFPEEILDSSVDHISYSGQLYGDEGVTRRAYKLKFPYMTNSQKQTMETFFNSVKKYKPFLTIFDSTDFTRLKPLYGYKPNNHAFRHIFDYQWECDMQLEEVK